MDFGCAAYCKYAEQCLGELSPDLLSKRQDLLKDRVAVEMKKYFRQDFKNINHAMKVARYAEQIASSGEGDLAIILSAAYLHGIACPEPGQDGPSSGAVCGGVGSVSLLLEGLGASKVMAEEVLGTITALRDNLHEGTSMNAKILRDAHTIARQQEESEQGLAYEHSLQNTVKELLETEGGRKVAEQILFKE
jgi:hypothetical protein